MQKSDIQYITSLAYAPSSRIIISMISFCYLHHPSSQIFHQLVVSMRSNSLQCHLETLSFAEWLEINYMSP